MKLKVIKGNFVVSKIPFINNELLSNEFVFLSKTDQEISLVCKGELMSHHAIIKEEGYKLIRIEGLLDFGLVGIIAKIATILSDEKISIFVISTFNTDYFLVKENNLNKTKDILSENGYQFI